jgi:hypothetical protein
MWVSFLESCRTPARSSTVFVAFACASDEIATNWSFFEGNSQIGYHCDASSIRGMLSIWAPNVSPLSWNLEDHKKLSHYTQPCVAVLQKR